MEILKRLSLTFLRLIAFVFVLTLCVAVQPGAAQQATKKKPAKTTGTKSKTSKIKTIAKPAPAKPMEAEEEEEPMPEPEPPVVARPPSYVDYEQKERFVTIAKALPVAEQVEYLDLSKQLLKVLPPEIKKFQNVVLINLKHNPLKKFPVELLELPSLKYLLLDSTGLSSIKLSDEEMAKAKQSNITFISLNGNKFGRFPVQLLQLAKLNELSLANNQISGCAFEKGYDPSTNALEIISLQDNRLSEMPLSLGQLPALTKLNLAGNDIRSLEKLSGYKNLKSLRLNDNPIKEVPASFYNLSQLEELNLDQTKITALPDSIGRLAKLRALTIPATFLKFPKDFGELKLLYELYLTYHKPISMSNAEANTKRLTEFPTAVLQCQRLKTLVIAGLELNQIPTEIAQLKRLETIDFSNSNLTAVPSSLFTLPSLKTLNLSGNKIKDIRITAGQLTSVTMLNLQNSPVNGQSLINLRRNLPQAKMNYFDVDFGLNFTSFPLPYKSRAQFRNLYAACDKNDPNAFFELGRFFEVNQDYGLAEKSYRAVTDNPAFTGTGKAMTCLLKIAEIYDDIKNEKNYVSPYKRKLYANYTDYSTTAAQNKAHTIYVQISDTEAKDAIAKQAQKKARARLNMICNEMADNLQKIYEYNNSEIERLIGGSGNMQNVSALGSKLMNDSAVQGSQTGTLLGAATNIFGKVSSSVKDDKADRLKADNQRLKNEIANLRSTATKYMSL